MDMQTELKEEEFFNHELSRVDMRLVEAPLGLLRNFNVLRLKEGIKRCVITNFSENSRHHKGT